MDASATDFELRAGDIRKQRQQRIQRHWGSGSWSSTVCSSGVCGCWANHGIHFSEMVSAVVPTRWIRWRVVSGVHLWHSFSHLVSFSSLVSIILESPGTISQLSNKCFFFCLVNQNGFLLLAANTDWYNIYTHNLECRLTLPYIVSTWN